ncbi:TPA: hypothetical protein ACKP22_005458 [Pseudomonas putida]
MIPAHANPDLGTLCATYDGHQVSVQWSLSSPTPVDSWVVALSSQDENGRPWVRWRAELPGDAPGAWLPLDEPLSTMVRHWVTVEARRAGNTISVSAPVILATLRPVLRSATYDGEFLRVEWQPTWQAAVGYEVLVTGADGTQFRSPVVDAGRTHAQFDKHDLGTDLIEGTDWSVQVAGIAENRACVLSDPMHFPEDTMVPPEIDADSLYRDGNRVSLTAYVEAQSEFVEYRVSVHSALTGTCYSLNTPVTIRGIDVPLPAPLPEFDVFSLSIMAVTESGAGLISAPQALVPTRPMILAAVLEATEVEVSWTIRDSTAFTRYRVQVFSPDNGNVAASELVDRTNTQLRLSLETALDPNLRWVCSVIATAKDAVGAESEWVELVTGEAKIVSSVKTASDEIRLVWQPPVSRTRPEYTQVEVLRAGAVIATEQVTGHQALLFLPPPKGVGQDESCETLAVRLTPMCKKAENRTQWRASAEPAWQ